MIRGIFVGKAGKFGFERGHVYEFNSRVENNRIVIKTKNGELTGKYERLEPFLKDWVLNLKG